MAKLFVKHWPVGDDWPTETGQREFILEMSEVEFESLRRLNSLLYSSTAPRFENFNPDDWLGQIRYALANGASAAPQMPNATE
jgi:hypothetical protein